MAAAFPDAAELERVLDLAARAPSAGNTQPWRWHVDNRGVQLFADWPRRRGDTDSDRRDVFLSCGAVLHHCAVAFAAAGWSSRVHRFPADDVLASFELDPQPAGDGSRELADAIALRRADRRPYSGSLPAGTVELLVMRAQRFGVQLSVVPTSRWTRIGATEFALRYAAGADQHDDDQAAMLVLATDTDSDLMRLRAGEALSHLTLSAAALGLATCPLTEPLRDPRNSLTLACEIFDGDAYPQALIRLGQQSDGDPLPPLERRSVAETTTFALQ
ncbi:nitroreductase family protein [[Mycobacterium] burgundiense]|uniref:Nitroreductase family protein n=1 Tax=[Mycobacterium] burgundiense TaxID=3064286 RepID=A0ABM9M7H5_9MYCO|nr:nitroreductase family protein [Mycolicibacterium sp. MU0053]CAJ1511137.1 nitroreductase family protein [Mycolicibacterium sp. MU0053]